MGDRETDTLILSYKEYLRKRRFCVKIFAMRRVIL